MTKHVDVSGAEAKDGIVTTEIYSGKFKRIADAPLSKEGKAHMQAQTTTFIPHLLTQWRQIAASALNRGSTRHGRTDFIGRRLTRVWWTVVSTSQSSL